MSSVRGKDKTFEFHVHSAMEKILMKILLILVILPFCLFHTSFNIIPGKSLACYKNLRIDVP